jgi:hypothetical protein
MLPDNLSPALFDDETSPACPSDRAVIRWRWVKIIGGMITRGEKPMYCCQKTLSQCHFIHYKSVMD